MVVIFFYFLQLSIGAFLFFLVIAFMTGAPFVPTTPPALKRALTLADLRPGDMLYDLGSGDGRVLFAASDLGAKAVGYEINPFLVFWTNVRAFLGSRPGVHAEWKNFWVAPLENADVVFVYLLPWRMEALEKRLMSQLRPGARIVSNSFVFPNIPLYKKDTSHHMFVFTIPKES